MIKNLFLHISLVVRHKWGVLINCAKCGLFFRGLVHDLSKFSPTELFESVKFYQGNRSPIGAARRAQGYSLAWLHHKGRNKHHIEYWTDSEGEEHPIMPYKYAVECVCDKLAATKIYAGKSYDRSMPLEHWQRRGRKVEGNEKVKVFLDCVFADVCEKGEDFVLNNRYMKEKYSEIIGK